MSIQSNVTCSALIFFCKLPVNFNLILSYSVFQNSLQTSSRHRSQECPGGLHLCHSVRFVISHNHQGWKRPLEITKSAGSEQDYVHVLQVPPQLETPQPPWVTCHSVSPPSQEKVCLNRISCILITYCLLSFHCTPLRRICVHQHSQDSIYSSICHHRNNAITVNLVQVL